MTISFPPPQLYYVGLRYINMGCIPGSGKGRTVIVRILVVIQIGILAIAPLPANADVGRRPNILFAFADDWGRIASTYAKLDGPGTINDVVRTPNFDRVAREGVIFRRAFVSA